jgi:protease IV
MMHCNRTIFFVAALTAGLLAVPGVPSQAATASKVASKATNGGTSKKAVAAVFTLKGTIAEKPIADDPLFSPGGSQSLRSLIARMKKTCDDTSVKAVVLLGSGGLGPAQVEEVRAVMDQIKAAGKPIYAHVDSLSTGRYLLLSGVTKLSVVPTGDVIITGLYGEQLYLRGLLDKLGVTPDFLTCGKYKSAGEMFMRNGPSDAARQMYSWLFDGIYQSSVEMIAQGRGVPTEKVRSWIDRGLYTAEQAKAAGIIDTVEQRQDFVARLKKEYGEGLVFDKRYGKKRGADVDFSSPFGVFKLWADLLQGTKTSASRGKPAVAVVYVDGPIMTGSGSASFFGSEGIAYSTPIRKALDKVAADDSIKAVVLRVSSPGGSAVASEIILDATKRVKAKKPLVVSMGDVAGSGGYYVACGADTIFADHSTVTASIGVVGGKLATRPMWEKLGVHWQPIERGKNAGLLSSDAPFSDAQRKQLQGWMDEIYNVFKGHVVAIRGSRLRKPIDQLAGGRVYTGAQALALGLVDKLGGLEPAIAHAAGQAGLKEKGYIVRVVPRPKSFLEILLSDLKDDSDSGKTLRMLLPPTAATGLPQAALPLLQSISPPRAAAITRALRQLETLSSQRAVLMMPEIIMAE